MRKAVAGTLSGAALLMAAAASPAMAEQRGPNERACEDGHGTHVAHERVPERNEQAHASIPHFCMSEHPE